ncbi:hypothetical protein PIB30_099189 [Stylosanthes scabra]|uniref:Putative plant transposon protein domain-containing protein n=1 Tax=Stylosanthes scabra TaxID=79078 RepID=A0ABU6SY10_9FABA|nr:hypothetical protein [Stylosanthes scabra]
MHPYTLIHASIMFGLGQAKSKMRSHTHPHKHGHTFAPTLTLHPSPARPPPTLSMTPTRSSTNINTHPCIPSLILSRLAWGRHGQGHPTTLASLVSLPPPKPVPQSHASILPALCLLLSFALLHTSPTPHNGILIRCYVVIEEEIFDAHRFKSPFHEHFFNSNVASKPIIPDTRFNLEKDQYPQIRQQIELRGWKRLNKPKKRISQTIIREFYANARIDPNNEVGPRFHTFVRGMLVNFSMDRIKTIMKFEGPLNSETSYRARMVEGNQDLDAVTRDLCVEGAVWSLGARNNPLYLKRSDLNPVARGWHEIITHNIMPTTNQSEVTLNRAVLIHGIMSSQEVRVEKIIVDAMMNIINKLHTSKPPLAFPNIIARLCE